MLETTETLISIFLGIGLLLGVFLFFKKIRSKFKKKQV